MFSSLKSDKFRDPHGFTRTVFNLIFTTFILFYVCVDGQLPDDAENIAINKTARHYMTPGTGAPSLAVDGNNATVSCTSPVAQPWWYVDLRVRAIVTSVEITSDFSTIDQNRLTNVSVRLSNSAPTAGLQLNISRTVLCANVGDISLSTTVTVTCTESSKLYRYVIVHSANTSLSTVCLAEVQVFSAPNRAFGRPAQQYVCTSSTKALLANDGDMNTRSCTSSVLKSWWAVQLATATNITSVAITSDFNTLDEFPLPSFSVLLSNTLPNTGTAVNMSTTTLCAQYNLAVGRNATIPLPCQMDASSQTFRNVIVQSDSVWPTPLCLTEIQVFSDLDLAVGRTTFQYIYTEGTKASLANDGDIATRSCTASGNLPWWSVRLASPVIVTRVEITFDYQSSSQTLLPSFSVKLSSTAQVAGSVLAGSPTLCKQYTEPVTRNSTISLECEPSETTNNYVIVQSDAVTPSFLCLTEVRVFSVLNRAANRSANQISTLLGGGANAGLATDGNLTTRSCTRVTNQPWWSVTLATAVVVERVVITSDFNTGSQFVLKDVVVLLSNTPPTQPLNQSTLTLCAMYNDTIAPNATINVTCAPSQQPFKYVIVQSTSTPNSTVCLTEVQVFAGPPNMALGRPSVQFTTYVGMDSSFANDGDALTASCTATSDQPWWAVKLTSASRVASVVITSSSLTDEEKILSNFVVVLSNIQPVASSPFNISTGTLCAQYNDVVAPGRNITLRCAANSGTFLYVIVQSQNASRALCLASVQVFSGVNWALNRAVRQSEPYAGTDASFAVDGDTTTDACTATCLQQPWWAVTLSTAYNVTGVTISSSSDTDTDYPLEYFVVRLSNVALNENLPLNVSATTLCAEYRDRIPYDGSDVIPCAPSEEGFKYVILQTLNSSTTLCLADVKVFGAVVKCSPLNVTNAILSSKSTNFAAVVRITCITGYARDPLNPANNSVTTTCNSRGLWTRFSITCQPVNCSTLNDSVYDLNPRDFYYPNSIQVACQTGYAFDPQSPANNTIVTNCTANGTWSETPGTCYPVNCSTLNDSLYVLNPKDFNYPNSVQITCQTGYAFDPQSNSIVTNCTANGTWSETPGTCYPVNCSTLNDSLYNLTSWDFYYPNSVQVTCQTGYAFDPQNPANNTIVTNCTENGTWSETPGTCSPIVTTELTTTTAATTAPDTTTTALDTTTLATTTLAVVTTELTTTAAATTTPATTTTTLATTTLGVTTGATTTAVTTAPAPATTTLATAALATTTLATTRAPVTTARPPQVTTTRTTTTTTARTTTTTDPFSIPSCSNWSYYVNNKARCFPWMCLRNSRFYAMYKTRCNKQLCSFGRYRQAFPKRC